MKTLKYDEITIGDQLPVLHKDPVTQLQIIRYAGANGDFNPIHIDQGFARNAGLSNCIAHGMMVMSMLGQLLTSWTDIRNVKTFNVDFKNVTKISDRLIASGCVSAKNDFEQSISVKLKAIDQYEEIKAEGLATISCSL